MRMRMRMMRMMASRIRKNEDGHEFEQQNKEKGVNAGGGSIIRRVIRM